MSRDLSDWSWTGRRGGEGAPGRPVTGGGVGSLLTRSQGSSWSPHAGLSVPPPAPRFALSISAEHGAGQGGGHPVCAAPLLLW